MRSPLYLDLELVQNVADYYDIAYALQTQVVEKGSTTTKGGGNVGAFGVGLALDRTKGTELQSSYEMPAKPLRVMNDVIDAVEASGDVRNVADDSEASVLSKGDLVVIEGTLALSAAGEVGNILARLLPGMAASGGVVDDAMKAKMMAGLFNDKGADSRQLYKITSDGLERNVVMAIEPSYFFRTNGFDDLETEVTVFGSVERVVSTGQSVSLERWLFPDVDRSARRLMKKQGLEKLLASMQEMTEIDVDEAKQLVGPALEIRPMAIY